MFMPANLASESQESGDQCFRQLCADIQKLPSVQRQIRERAYEMYLRSAFSGGFELEHWLSAEEEILRWIDSALEYIGRSGRRVPEPAS